MSWIENLEFRFLGEERKEGLIFKNARAISAAALAMVQKENLPIVTLEGDELVKMSQGGKYRRVIGTLRRRPRILSGQKLEMP